jgi:DNA-directed RNA polymerase subunit RPC12/RpoP
MKPGSEIVCPHCGKDSFASKKTEMDGWTKKGDILVCASCGAKLADLSESGASVAQNSDSPALSSLAEALGVDEMRKPTLKVTDDEKRFCRDCAHFISHPFLNRCSLFGKEVAPMDDCGEFKAKTEKDS